LTLTLYMSTNLPCRHCYTCLILSIPRLASILHQGRYGWFSAKDTVTNLDKIRWSLASSGDHMASSSPSRRGALFPSKSGFGLSLWNNIAQRPRARVGIPSLCFCELCCDLPAANAECRVTGLADRYRVRA
jgi:hypothetical protein